ncbi:MAG TPA: aminopeptidase [Rhodocyclaceae bacterium]
MLRHWIWLAAAMLSGCASPGYYLQAIGGQIEILRASRPIDEAIADPSLSPATRQRLETASRMRDFASRELGLPDNRSYRKYADLHRPYVTWNVFAAKPLSVEPKRWCFPVAGCVSYRGYFSEAEARKFAAGLRAEDYDVFVAGIPAYSTLGWFSDPLLNTFIHYPDSELARIIFHELAHQVVYVSGDTAFNESFAVTVEEAGVHRWIDAYGTPAEREEFDRREQHRRDFEALVTGARSRLDAIYQSHQPDAAKLAEKKIALEQLQADYRIIRDRRWGGYKGYDRWFAIGINNATLASIGLYLQDVPAFQSLLAENGGDLPRFYAAVRKLADLPRAERKDRLSEAMAQALLKEEPGAR